MKNTVRMLTEQDEPQVQLLDELSGNHLSQWLDAEGYAYGIFEDDCLIGYCSLGYADDVCEEIKSYPQQTPDALLLSDVYIHPECRHLGLGSKLIQEAILLKLAFEKSEETVFCQPSSEHLNQFYEKLGFELIDETCMVRHPSSFLLRTNNSPQV